MIVHFIRWVHLTKAFRLQVGSNVHLNIAQNNIATARYGYSTCKINVLCTQDIVTSLRDLEYVAIFCQFVACKQASKRKEGFSNQALDF